MSSNFYLSGYFTSLDVATVDDSKYAGNKNNITCYMSQHCWLKKWTSVSWLF